MASQQPAVVDRTISDILPKMKSSDWQTRKDAFYELLALASGQANNQQPYLHQQLWSKFFSRVPGNADRVRLSLVELLQREDDLQHEAEQRHSTTPGEFSDYYASVIAVVSGLHDERAIPALLGAIKTGEMATRGLAAFGRKAFAPVLRLLSSPDPMTRAAALFALRDMLKMGKLNDPALRAQTREALRSSLRDRDSFVRASAVWVIGTFGDKDFIPALRYIAKYDPTKIPGQKADEGGDFYPVRHAARSVLRQLSHR
jgi:HEAT repeat protein